MQQSTSNLIFPNNDESRLPLAMEALHQSELQRINRVTKQKWLTSRIAILLGLDVTFCAMLYVTYERSKGKTDDQPVFFWILMVSIIRVALVTLGAWFAITVGLPTTKAITRQMEASNSVPVPAALSDLMAPLLEQSHLVSSSPTGNQIPNPEKDNGGSAEYQPPYLNINQELKSSPKGDDISVTTSPCSPPSFEAVSDDSMNNTVGLFGTMAAQKLEEETRYHRAVSRVEKTAHARRNIVLAAIFVCVTVTNFVCCVWFVNASNDLENIFGNGTFLSLPVHGWLVTGIIIVASAEFLSVQRLVFRTTSDTGVMIRSFHPHKLYFKPNMSSHSCDNCHIRFRNHSIEGYTCRVCDFDLCLRCFKLRSMDRGEGVLRSDKGPKVIVEYSMWMYLKRALILSFPFIHWLFISFIFLVATQVVGLVLPTYQGKVIDDVFKQDLIIFRHDITIYAIGSIVTAVLSAVSSLCVQIVQKNLEAGVRVKLFRSVLSQDVAFFDGMMTGQITSRIQSDTQELVSPCYTIVNNGLSNVIMLTGALYMCLTTSWQLTILALCSIGPIVTITNSYARWARPVWLQVWQALGDANSVALQAIINIRSVRSFATEEHELDKYQDTLSIMLRKGLLNSFVSSFAGFLSSSTELAVGVLILAIGGNMVIQGFGTLTVGRLIAFQLYWNKMDGAYNSLNGILNTLIQTSAAAERVFSLMECKPDIETTPKLRETNSWGRVISDANTSERQPTIGVQKRIPHQDIVWNIKINSLYFTYQMRPEIKVLKGVDLEIPAGSVSALVGRSGGGKSTLIHLMQRFYDPTAGSVSYGGVDLSEIDLKWYRSQIGVVAQDTQLFNISIRENICYGCSYPVPIAAVVDAAKKACIHDFIITLDEGYATRVGEQGTRLSGGQKQRVAIARALLRRPRLLLLDEATSALDAQSEAQVQKALDNLMLEMAGRCTIVLVAHRLSTVINANQIFVIDEGRVAERGTHPELLAAQGIYANLVRQQLSKKGNQISEIVDENP